MSRPVGMSAAGTRSAMISSNDTLWAGGTGDGK
jgi:hypothetical protein